MCSSDLDNALTTTSVISADEPNKAGKCVGENGGSVSTATGVGGSATTANVPATDELCTPISIEEHARTSPTEWCLPDLVCQTDFVITNAGAATVDDPIILTLTFYGSGLNTNLPLVFTSETRQIEVEECTDEVAAIPDPCIESSRARRQSLTRVVRWTGLDPTWTD